ncbi:methyl-accepting chemotaxis protein [Selenomonas sp. F0473]|uniref:methyl-accepting chemotaxis protein n=1 Tax=Selenomonas sp. F0473 TaxID=999423 RepID=UPI00031453C0|nr:methyl-accepting chemotaxis protein [Selenomonas sp. F0473]
MGIKQKLLLMGTLMALLVVAICGVGYYKAQSALEESIAGEINAVLHDESDKLDGWMSRKMQRTESAANLVSALDGNPVEMEREVMSLARDDKEVIDLAYGAEDGRFISWVDGNFTGQFDPLVRDWYKNAKASGKPLFTPVYQDDSTKKPIISAAVPYKGADGTFRGVVLSDISLSALEDKVKELKYHGVGEGIVVESDGLIIASSEGQAMHKVDENEVLKVRFSEMLQNKSGYFSMEKDGQEQIIAYSTVPSTGWIVGIAVPESVAFAQLNSLKVTYTVMSLIGIVLVAGIILALLRFAATITGATDRLMHHVDALAKGRLNLEELPVTSQDELGRLASNFNAMMKNIRDLIKQVAGTAEQLAAASEELTAGAHQMAESATNVASTVVEVANGTERQLDSVAGAKESIDGVSADVTRMSGQAEKVAGSSAATADAAQKGEALMNEAMAKMTGIEQSVMHSAEVVEKLGESSKQIGEIVESISAIADQTNLLALNAAIEAARAGETGRGFAVVAEEVRKLAEESRTAAEQIKERITVVQRDTEEAVAAMQSGTAEVQEGTAAIHEVGAQFQNIMHMVDEIKVEMAEINGAMRTVAKGTENLVASADDINEISQTTAEHMQSISSSSESQSASSQEIASASQALATLATDLQNTTNKFKF